MSKINFGALSFFKMCTHVHVYELILKRSGLGLEMSTNKLRVIALELG